MDLKVDMVAEYEKGKQQMKDGNLKIDMVAEYEKGKQRVRDNLKK